MNTNEEYWTYAFLWCLNGKIKVNKKVVERKLKTYYEGLIENNFGSMIDISGKYVSVKTNFNAIENVNGDLNFFKGSI